MSGNFRRAAAMVVVADLMLAVILMMGAILALMTISKSKTPPRIETLGYYAIVITWPNPDAPIPGGNDVDLYVQDPSGAIAYYQNLTAGQMNLEHDCLGAGNVGSCYQGRNEERLILRGAQPGEYTVNVQMYQNYTKRPSEVTVTLWRLRGNDKIMTQTKVTINGTGDEKTAFRFTLDRHQNVTNINHLQKRFVGSATGGSPSYPYPGQSPPTFGGGG